MNFISLSALAEKFIMTFSHYWQDENNDNNIINYPSVEPEVIKCKKNPDGTITLTVNVRCTDYKTNCLFTHEVTIKEFNNGTFKYLSNKVTYKSDNPMPSHKPRLSSQKTDH